MRNTVRKTIATALLLLVCACTLCGTAFAAPSSASKTEVVNNIQSGDVDINLIVDAFTGKILPGQSVNNQVKIENNSEPIWLRVKVVFPSDEINDWLTDDVLALADSSNWEKIGDYFYYKKEVDSKTQVTFINGFNIPVGLNNALTNTSFELQFIAEAVQSKNFTPIWDSEDNDPWFGTAIEVRANTGAYTPGVTSSESFSVEYKSGTEGMIHVGEDFFANWENIMPGDTYTDTLLLKNSYKPASIYFYTENDIDDELLNALQLVIKNGDNVLYSGTLSGTNTPVFLGDYFAGDSDTLTFSVSMPSQLGNSYAMTSAQTKWIFYADYPVLEPAPLPETGGVGVTAYVAVGALLTIVSAAAVLVRKEKKDNA